MRHAGIMKSMMKTVIKDHHVIGKENETIQTIKNFSMCSGGFSVGQGSSTTRFTR